MTDLRYVLEVIAAMALVTFGLRALPFVAGRWLEKHPLAHRLGEFLPLAIMALLLLSSSVSAVQDDPHGPWPEIVAVGLTAVLQWRTKIPLLSILTGTGVYVVLRNFI